MKITKNENGENIASFSADSDLTMETAEKIIHYLKDINIGIEDSAFALQLACYVVCMKSLKMPSIECYIGFCKSMAESVKDKKIH